MDGFELTEKMRELGKCVILQTNDGGSATTTDVEMANAFLKVLKGTAVVVENKHLYPATHPVSTFTQQTD